MASSSPTTVPADATKPRVLLMGARRAGKSSIQKVVFHKMSPHEVPPTAPAPHLHHRTPTTCPPLQTLFLESTNKIVKNSISFNLY